MGEYKVVIDEKDEPTPQDTFDHIFGAAPDTYSWWREFSGDWDFRKDAPANWTMTVKVSNPEGAGFLTREVTHKSIMDAIRKILSGEVSQYLSGDVRRECLKFVLDRDGVDFDAGTADEVLQVAVLGSIVYG